MNLTHVYNLTFFRLVGRLHVLDLKKEAAENPDYEVTVNDIEKYEEMYGRIEPGSVVSIA